MTEIREQYGTGITVIEPRWELTPEPRPRQVMEVEFARNLVVDTACAFFDANARLAHAGKVDGHSAMERYFACEDALMNAIAFYKTVTVSMVDGEEGCLP